MNIGLVSGSYRYQLSLKNITCEVVQNSTSTACVSPHELHGFKCEPGVFGGTYGERALSCAYTGPERWLAPFHRLLCATVLSRPTVLGNFYADERIVRVNSSYEQSLRAALAARPNYNFRFALPFASAAQIDIVLTY